MNNTQEAKLVQMPEPIPTPEVTEKRVPIPEPSQETIPAPAPGDPANQVQFGDTQIEIKPTKLKYHRDRTAAFYRIQQQLPLIDVLALQDGILDPERSSDKMLFDWLIAVTDDPVLVTRNYDKIDADTVDRMLKIFCRINHIDEKDAERKNKQTQATNP